MKVNFVHYRYLQKGNSMFSVPRAVRFFQWLRQPIFLAACLMLMFSACGGKDKIKKVSEESRITQEAFSLAETLRTAYLEGDRRSLERHSTQEGYRELVGALKEFDSAELTFTPTWVKIDGSEVYLTVSWKGLWRADNRVTEERGAAIFVLEGRPLKLATIQRENPFRQPE